MWWARRHSENRSPVISLTDLTHGCVRGIMRWGDTEPAPCGFLPGLIEEVIACQVGRLLTEPANAGRCVKLLLSVAITGSQEVERTLGIIHGTVLITLP